MFKSNLCNSLALAAVFLTQAYAGGGNHFDRNELEIFETNPLEPMQKVTLITLDENFGRKMLEAPRVTVGLFNTFATIETAKSLFTILSNHNLEKKTLTDANPAFCFLSDLIFGDIFNEDKPHAELTDPAAILGKSLVDRQIDNQEFNAELAIKQLPSFPDLSLYLMHKLVAQNKLNEESIQKLPQEVQSKLRLTTPQKVERETERVLNQTERAVSTAVQQTQNEIKRVEKRVKKHWKKGKF